MKLILTQDELQAALRDGVPAVSGQQVTSVEIQKNSPTDFAILQLAPIATGPLLPPAPEAP